MQNRISYGCTALVGTNKVGDLVKDSDGYYEVVLGALNATNSAGDYYPFEQAKQLFEGSAELMRRIANGNVRGEVGHPRYQRGMTEREWFMRVADLYEPNLCCHFSRIDLSFNTLTDKATGQPLVAVIGKVKPSGANERYLERQLDNPKENVCFSIRCFTNDQPYQGRYLKIMRRVVTWDQVNEPGIAVANKYSTPSLESVGMADLDEYFFASDVLQDVADNIGVGAGVSMEAAGIAKDLLVFQAEIERTPKIYVPASMRW